ncbi:MAG: hypothetical protein MK008_01300 [Bdellovibrionales bacterium]|nr:hypothetical protein [Bdellovibrionales bacterium]
MKKLIWLFLVFSPLNIFAKSCPYPAEPINWIMRYCAFKNKTGDEIIIQKSNCFLSAENDLKSKDTCKIKEKYKRLFCQERLNIDSKYKSEKNCIIDKSIKPYLIGE